MAELNYEVLDTTNSEAVAAYEKGVYRAFVPYETPALTSVWDFDHKARRVVSKIPYSSQVIFVGKLDSATVSGVSVNLNMNEELQLEMMGFEIDKSQNGLAEGLGVFNLQVFSGVNPIAILLKKFAFKKIQELDISIMYGTCSDRVLRGYQALGWKAVDERVFMDEKKYLLEIIV